MEMSKPLKIFITGIAGTGKSSIARELVQRGIDVIDVDHVAGLCSWVHNETGEKVHEPNPDNEFIDQHDYQCNMDMLTTLMNKSEDLVFVFGCVGDNSKFLPLFEKVFLLQCSSDTLLERLNTRTTNDFAKDIKVQERMLEWRKIFDEMMLKAGATPIDTEQTLSLTIDELMDCVTPQERLSE